MFINTKEMKYTHERELFFYIISAVLAFTLTLSIPEDKILKAIDRLSAGGSTAGGAGLRLAYQTAARSYINQGNNRVIIATDGLKALTPVILAGCSIRRRAAGVYFVAAEKPTLTTLFLVLISTTSNSPASTRAGKTIGNLV